MVPNLGEETVALFKSKEAGLGLSSFFDKASDLDRRSWHSIVGSNRKKGQYRGLHLEWIVLDKMGVTFEGERERASG